MAPNLLGHLFPRLVARPGLVKRRQRLSDTIEALINEFARHSPGFDDDLLVVDSTPVECGRSVETMRRSALADAADYGYCASHSRCFWGFRLHGLFAIDGTPRALALTSPKTAEREVCLNMLARVERAGPVAVVGHKGYAGRDFENEAAELDVLIVRPPQGRARQRPAPGPDPPTREKHLLDRHGHARPRNTTARAHCTPRAPASPPSSWWPRPPRSRSTTASAAHPATSPPYRAADYFIKLFSIAEVTARLHDLISARLPQLTAT